MVESWDGWVFRMWVRILAMTVVLEYLRHFTILASLHPGVEMGEQGRDGGCLLESGVQPTRGMVHRIIPQKFAIRKK